MKQITVKIDGIDVLSKKYKSTFDGIVTDEAITYMNYTQAEKKASKVNGKVKQFAGSRIFYVALSR